MAGYPESQRKKIVAGYQQQYQESGISIDDYSKQVQVHHTTIRQWLKRYAPEFETSRRKSTSRTITESVEVETEWYPHTDFQEPDLLPPPEPSTGHQEPDVVEKLREEIKFLKAQVVYWMQQEPVQI